MLGFYDLPSSHGCYVVHLCLLLPRLLTVGRLGSFHLPAGHYFYVGSAYGAGGLRSRLGRHLRGSGALHWHIDYLRAVAEVRDALYTVADRTLECEWSERLAQLPHAFIPVPHFGSSDCRSGCVAHLIALPFGADLAGVPQVLKQTTGTPIRFFRCAGTASRAWSPATCFAS